MPQPTELLADPDNPANDAFYTNLRAARALAVSLSRNLKPKHIRIAKLSHTGLPPKQIATEVGVTPATVYKQLKRPEVERLIVALQHVAMLTSGPELQLRKNMLWRIARRNEQDEPTTTIQALKELNRLEGAYPVQAPTAPSINITINQDSLPRTALDAQHE